MKIGFIGCGNMARAMIGGMVGSGSFDKGDIMASNRSGQVLEIVEKEWGISTTLNNRELAQVCDVVVLAIKPQFYDKVMKEIAGEVKDGAVIVTIAPGYSLEKTEEIFSRELKIARAMPNTPAMVGEGMTGICFNDKMSEEDKTLILKIFSAFGRVEEVPEGLMDAVGSVSGSAPAYFFMMIEAMADGAVLLGMPRKQAYSFAAQAALGSAKMVLETGLHPGDLKDMVCSPGGTTIEAVRVLEEKGLRSALIEGMVLAARKSKGMA